ncbi:glycosyltransferase family 4 protein [Thomasclavelia sp.]|uniref:glycosyltransferase family 4 protein n=1 Tax=Thomasclavelia sp. TaxID=3025757 RepID=UPI0025F4AE38|nr:glycosyltransferase family 4 protein [Thomasclavelia sp.]
MKKILIVATVQSHVAQFHLPIIEILKKQGYEIHVAGRNNLAIKSGLELNQVDKIYDIPFKRTPFSMKNIEAYKKLKEVIDNNNYDIIQCNTPVGGIITRLAAINTRKKGTKVIYTAHGFHFYKGAPLKNWILYYPLEKAFSYFTDLLITINFEDYYFAKKKFKCQVEHIFGVGVSSKKFYVHDENDVEIKKYIDKLGISNNDFCIICIGELNENKSQITLIYAIHKIINECPNIKLLLAGNGPKEEELKKLVYKLNLNNNIIFLGYTRKLDKIIPICECLVSCSLREGLPLNIIEALLCGKPVIASKNRGHVELVKNNENGYLFESKNIEECSRLIKKIYFDKETRNRLAKNSSISVEDYKLENVLKDLQRFYNTF